MQERSGIGFGPAQAAADEIVGMSPVRLVLVEWEDSYGCSSNWQDLDHPKPRPMRCRSVGWLYYDGPDCKLLVPHVAEGNGESVPIQGCGDMTIPASAVRSIKELRLPAR